jgi:hypothetical protein
MITPPTHTAAVRCGGDAMASCLRRSVLIGAAVLWLCGPVRAEDADEEPDPVILGIMLADAALTLAQGLAATALQGKPLSAKFENADGDIQLSVYSATADGFVETILNPKTGAIVSTAPLTDADDLTQAGALAAVLVSLAAATEKALAEHPQSRAVSVIPEFRDGQPRATVKLLRPTDFVTVTERLN